jgi:hypothetical protein
MTAALLDVGVLVEDLLDLARVDVVAAADDHVLLAVDDVQVPVVVGARDVAGVEPAAPLDVGRRVVAAPVAGHDRRPAHDELAGRARDDLGAGVVDDADLRALQPPRGSPAASEGQPSINRYRSLSSPSHCRQPRASSSTPRDSHGAATNRTGSGNGSTT